MVGRGFAKPPSHFDEVASAQGPGIGADARGGSSPHQVSLIMGAVKAQVPKGLKRAS